MRITIELSEKDARLLNETLGSIRLLGKAAAWKIHDLDRTPWERLTGVIRGKVMDGLSAIDKAREAGVR